MSRHANIPLFIPHEGCPNACVFCDQRAITGKCSNARRDIIPEIEEALSTLKVDDTAEIAFFGGSFTGIDRAEMLRLLSDAYEYVKSGKVESIRLSTRPDYIDDEILSILKAHGVRHIELGIQSTDDGVLLASGRGHTSAQTVAACEKIVSQGFVLGGQMMLGLPGSNEKSELQTARDIVSLGAREARIYPTAVFRDTRLCEMTESGEYTPLSLDSAIKRAADCYEIFAENGVKVLRVGLSSSDSLSDPTKAPYGVTHPAFGELCEGELYRRKLFALIKGSHFPSVPFSLKVICPKGEVSKVCGHGGRNKKALFELFSSLGTCPKKISFAQNTNGTLEKGCVELEYITTEFTQKSEN